MGDPESRSEALKQQTHLTFAGSQVYRSRMPRYSPRNFSPRIPVTISARQASLLKAAESPNSTMPSPTVPTAPIPVHTAYAVPSGRLRVATRSEPLHFDLDEAPG